LQLRRELADLTDLGRQNREVAALEAEKLLWVRMRGEGGQALLLAFFGGEAGEVTLPWPEGAWDRRLDSTEARWGGPGGSFPPEISGGREIRLTCPPHALAVYLLRE
jgi:maltooligosyltrehalose trehalohydrolase